jgi:hypothetical protein
MTPERFRQIRNLFEAALVAFGSPLEIVLPAAQKSPTDTILKRQLAEWRGP